MANPKLAIAHTEEEEEESRDSGDDSRSNSDSGASMTEGRTMSSDTSEEIAKRETQSVFYLRMLVLFVLCAAAAGISVVVWLTTSNAEQEEFETNFHGVALKVLTSFEDIVGQVRQRLKMGVTVLPLSLNPAHRIALIQFIHCFIRRNLELWRD